MSMNTQRELTPAENAELDALDLAVTTAIAARQAWLDAKMYETSQLQVGDDIYDLDTGNKVGKVAALYRFWRDRDEGIRDDSYYCDYQYETAPNCFDNTSRQPGRSFGTREQAAQRARLNAARFE